MTCWHDVCVSPHTACRHHLSRSSMDLDLHNCCRRQGRLKHGKLYLQEEDVSSRSC